MKAKDRAKFGLKLVLGAGLVYYVLRSNMVDFAALGEVIFSPWNLGISLLMLSGMTFCIATRWFLLVRAQGLALSYKDMISLTMIGNFFNTFMPGSVGGDLIKAWYVAGKEPTRKTKAIFTVLLDRVIGLTIIVFSAAITLLFYTDWFAEYPELRLLAYSLWAFALGSIVFGILFFLSTRWKLKLADTLVSMMRRVRVLSNLIDALLLYRDHLGTVLKAVVLSIGNILILTCLWIVHGQSMGIEMPVSHYFFVVPVGMTVSAIPLLPGGIGVGQVAFFTLFSWVGMANPEQGGALCTLFQVYVILFNCLGAIFYLRFKSTPRVPADKALVTEGTVRTA